MPPGAGAPTIPKSVLFVCNRNAVRSPMAHALADRHCRRRVFVHSVGLAPGDLDPFSVAVMDELGIDISGHRPRSIEDLPARDFDLIVSLTPEAQHRAVELTRDSDAAVEYWPTFDPTIESGARAHRLAAYRTVRDDLARRIAERLPFHGAGHL